MIISEFCLDVSLNVVCTNLRYSSGRTSDGGDVKSGMIVCYVDGPPPPLAFLPPPSTWPLFSAVPAPSIQPTGGFGAGPVTDMVMARNVNGSGRTLIYLNPKVHFKTSTRPMILKSW